MADSPIDQLIDEVLGGDFDTERRAQVADEVAYQYFSKVREQAGGQLDAETAQQINSMVPIPREEKDDIMKRTNRVARRVLRPLGYKMLQVQGLDPETAEPAAARAALEAQLTPQQQAEVDAEAQRLFAQQQAEVDAEAQRLFAQVYLPEMQAALEDIGVDTRDPNTAWEQFGSDVMSRAEPPQQQSNQAPAVALGAVLGAVVVLGVSCFGRWLQRRRQQRRAGSSLGYSDEVEEVEELVSDSLQDDASAYAE
ncbi:hypothetical protein OEZ85_014359 [Tetradesmus obliquus]|uniref:Uncharacterized protein n=1 Tax=Tetradesmus obliquus TaxID=3088 RepID=A0ABY8UA65_TETOB|nr:hypothetical protein OEZ85_014359 [Tetradesmus obliquus]